jgi:hypothetical protein
MRRPHPLGRSSHFEILRFAQDDGVGESRLMRARDVIEAALSRLRSNETLFLHVKGVCSECDIARSANAVI